MTSFDLTQHIREQVRVKNIGDLIEANDNCVIIDLREFWGSK